MGHNYLQKVRNMMYGFGDSINPRPESVRLMEDIVIDYIVALVSKVCLTFLIFFRHPLSNTFYAF